MNKKKKQSFEELLFQTMKDSGLLFPESDEEIEKFEARFTKHQLPEQLQNPDEILNRNKEKITNDHSLIYNAAALISNDDESESAKKKSKRKTSGPSKKG
ncbi:hypothetical protein KK083_09685 [Fulvivirgaceae bacterium PWU4]|uniref:Uncharacterized protein n=1 Tax=Chryseosolibacter histidini TaxID=2782349 RepID=A0AAP2DIW6_9BACT|nr:hypothetical protein [Chryseosolibacter histidini]MBT1697145.1 hypothetical protein [Chryseosolibacter histidini]